MFSITAFKLFICIDTIVEINMKFISEAASISASIFSIDLMIVDISFSPRSNLSSIIDKRAKLSLSSIIDEISLTHWRVTASVSLKLIAVYLICRQISFSVALIRYKLIICQNADFTMCPEVNSHISTQLSIIYSTRGC